MFHIANNTYRPERREGDHVELVKRRLQALSPYIAPLEFDVPALVKQTNILNKFSSMQQARKVSKKDRKITKKAIKRDKSLHKTARKYNRTPEELEALDATWDSEDSSIDSDVEVILSVEDEIRKLDEKNTRREKKTQAKLSGASSQKRIRVYEKNSAEKKRSIQRRGQSWRGSWRSARRRGIGGSEGKTRGTTKRRRRWDPCGGLSSATGIGKPRKKILLLDLEYLECSNRD
jgi:hypothetical protein